MRLIILFVLIASIFALTWAAWNVNSSQIDFFSTKNRAFRHQQIDKIRGTTDIALLKEQAVDLVLNLDERAMEKGSDAIKAGNLLLLTVFLTVIAQLIVFLEIAGRGKTTANKM